MNSDFVELLSLFKTFGVKYLLVGGYAVMYYTEPRFTKDFDLFVGQDQDNVSRFAKALEEFGFKLSADQIERFQQPDALIALGVPPNRIDFLNEIPGLNFDEAFRRGSEADFAGSPVSIVSIEDLIASKRAAGRPQDLLDIARLESGLK